MIKKYMLSKNTYQNARAFFCTPLLKSPDLGFPTSYWYEMHTKFFDLEASADRFARFRRYPPQNSKLRKSKMCGTHKKFKYQKS